MSECIKHAAILYAPHESLLIVLFPNWNNGNLPTFHLALRRFSICQPPHCLLAPANIYNAFSYNTTMVSGWSPAAYIARPQRNIVSHSSWMLCERKWEAHCVCACVINWFCFCANFHTIIGACRILIDSVVTWKTRTRWVWWHARAKVRNLCLKLRHAILIANIFSNSYLFFCIQVTCKL